MKNTGPCVDGPQKGQTLESDHDAIEIPMPNHHGSFNVVRYEFRNGAWHLKNPDWVN